MLFSDWQAIDAGVAADAGGLVDHHRPGGVVVVVAAGVLGGFGVESNPRFVGSSGRTGLPKLAVWLCSAWFGRRVEDGEADALRDVLVFLGLVPGPEPGRLGKLSP